MSPSNHGSSHEKPYFRRSFGRRDSSETLKERARAGRLKSSGSSIGKSPVKVLSPDPLIGAPSTPKFTFRDSKSSVSSSHKAATAVMMKESSSEDDDECQTQAVRGKRRTLLEFTIDHLLNKSDNVETCPAVNTCSRATFKTTESPGSSCIETLPTLNVKPIKIRWCLR